MGAITRIRIFMALRRVQSAVEVDGPKRVVRPEREEKAQTPMVLTDDVAVSRATRLSRVHATPSRRSHPHQRC